MSQRKILFNRKLTILIKHKKKSVFDRIQTWSHFIKSYSRLRIVLSVHSHYEKYLKQQTFSRLQRFLFQKDKPIARTPHRSSMKDQREINDLKIQLQDMTVQL